jgi:hypothetical protein
MNVFSDLPRSIADWSGEQRERVIAYLAKKPLRELRRRQCVIRSQIIAAHQRLRALPEHSSERQRLIDGFKNLNDMFDVETAAVGRREFGS